MKLLALMRKEFARFFRDPRLIVTMIFPGILIYAIYSILGSAIWQEEEKYTYRAYVSGESQLVALIEASVEQEGLFTPVTDLEAAKKEVEEGKADALVVFPEGFDEAVMEYTPALGTPAPRVSVYYRSADEQSASFFAITSGILSAFEDSLSNKFDVAGENFSSEKDIAAMMLGGLIPFLIVIFVFSAGMSITLESVAGEKERGTLSTVLVTSVKRSSVALGKVIPLGCIAAIGAASSFLGVALSMPKLLGRNVGGVLGGYSAGSYLLLFMLILSVVPCIVAAITAVSAYAKSVKEASAYTSVIMIFMMVLSLVSTFIPGIGEWVVAIPLLNAVTVMQTILAGGMPVWQSFVSLGVNLLFTALIVWLAAWMLGNERIMFGK